MLQGVPSVLCAGDMSEQNCTAVIGNFQLSISGVGLKRCLFTWPLKEKINEHLYHSCLHIVSQGEHLSLPSAHLRLGAEPEEKGASQNHTQDSVGLGNGGGFLFQGHHQELPGFHVLIVTL